jgi:hypothetical protein
MVMTYEVWDTETANQIGAFQTLAEAEALLRDVLRVNGPGVACDMAIVAYHRTAAGEYEPTTVLEGSELVARLGQPQSAGRATATG